MLTARSGFGSQEDSLRITNKISFKWQNDFATSEQERLKTLLYTIGYKAQIALGELPFPLTYFIRKKELSQPVGNCFTKWKGKKRGVHIGVDLRYSDKQILESWKIHHEIAHLYIPPLIKENEWFYEGFATYFGQHIMKEVGIYDERSMDEYIRKRYDEIRDDFEMEGSFVEVVTHHQDNWNISAYYWGGGIYFYRANRALESKYGTSFPKILAAYQTNGRMKDRKLSQILRSWNEILGSTLFTHLLWKLKNQDASKVMSDV